MGTVMTGFDMLEQGRFGNLAGILHQLLMGKFSVSTHFKWRKTVYSWCHPEAMKNREESLP